MWKIHEPPGQKKWEAQKKRRGMGVRWGRKHSPKPPIPCQQWKTLGGRLRRAKMGANTKRTSSPAHSPVRSLAGRKEPLVPWRWLKKEATGPRSGDVAGGKSQRKMQWRMERAFTGGGYHCKWAQHGDTDGCKSFGTAIGDPRGTQGGWHRKARTLATSHKLSVRCRPARWSRFFSKKLDCL